MRLGLRLLLAFLLITGVAAFFVLRVAVTEIKPSVREVMEDLMVDAANLLAELAVPELAAHAATGESAAPLPTDGAFTRAVEAYVRRPIDATIWDLHKTSLDLRVLLTDARGIVVYDSGIPSALGEDFSRWRDVALTLRGRYGARSSPDPYDDRSSVMYVAAPVRDTAAAGPLLGVLVVAKPLSSVMPFVRRAERKLLTAGVVLLGLSLVVGVAVTAWVVGAVRRLRRYALTVGSMAASGLPQVVPTPRLPGELGELAKAMDVMRQRLEGRHRLESRVRALTHELKTPLTAIRGAAELLQDPLADADRRRFAVQITDQADRLQQVVERMLTLSRLEGLDAVTDPQPLALAALVDEALQVHAAAIGHKRLAVHWLQRDEAAVVPGQHEMLLLALSNVLGNAVTHSPPDTALELSLVADAQGVRWTLRDHGPGVPAWALARLGQPLFSLANAQRGERGARGSGLGLAIVRQVMLLHGGELRIERAEPGLRVTLHWPAPR